MRVLHAFAAAILLAALAVFPAHAMSRVKDITQVQGLRGNQLIGYGLVVGLSGTGDSLRNAPFTDQSIKSMLDHLGVNVRDANPRVENVAAVIVTAELPAFAQPGQRLDVTVSSLGDASSLRGGTLVLTALLGADGVIYAAAQGPLAVTGVSAQGDAQSVEEGVPTVGRIPNGAMVERALPATLGDLSRLSLELANPDFQTAVSVAEAINGFSQQAWGVAVAKPADHRSIRLERPKSVDAATFLAAIGGVAVMPDAPARVVIDERTGTIVIGENVRLSTVAITHGAISIRVTELPTIVQPNPFAEGETAEQPMTDIAVAEAGDDLAIIGGADLDMLVEGLNRLGVKPKGIIAVLQAVKSAGALQAELVMQ
ncbi:MAG: flagellar basal body P-ring protein FlgI [Rhizobiaceae bacterium]|jgi:flagellar P-ring protein precursor FlgI|nr:flagellar basal body P-ring protein FlgI [Rhizobiaceae bacterium]